jgi:hypothetical protein
MTDYPDYARVGATVRIRKSHYAASFGPPIGVVDAVVVSAYRYADWRIRVRFHNGSEDTFGSDEVEIVSLLDVLANIN